METSNNTSKVAQESEPGLSSECLQRPDGSKHSGNVSSNSLLLQEVDCSVNTYKTNQVLNEKTKYPGEGMRAGRLHMPLEYHGKAPVRVISSIESSQGKDEHNQADTDTTVTLMSERERTEPVTGETDIQTSHKLNVAANDYQILLKCTDETQKQSHQQFREYSTGDIEEKLNKNNIQPDPPACDFESYGRNCERDSQFENLSSEDGEEFKDDNSFERIKLHQKSAKGQSKEIALGAETYAVEGEAIISLGSSNAISDIKSKHKTNSNSTECLPIILSVRGNANDFDTINEINEMPDEQPVENYEKMSMMSDKYGAELCRETNVSVVTLPASRPVESAVEKCVDMTSSTDVLPSAPKIPATASVRETLAFVPLISSVSSSMIHPRISVVNTSTKANFPSPLPIISSNKVTILSSPFDTNNSALKTSGSIAVSKQNESEANTVYVKRASNILSSTAEPQTAQNNVKPMSLLNNGSKITLSHTQVPPAMRPRVMVSLLNPTQTFSSSVPKPTTSEASASGKPVSEVATSAKTIARTDKRNPPSSRSSAISVSPTVVVVTSASLDKKERQCQHPSPLTMMPTCQQNACDLSATAKRVVILGRGNSLCQRSFTYEGMNRCEIFESGLLEISEKQRTDMTKEYVCKVCGDEFHSQEFLRFHLDRVVFILKYYCKVCVTTLSFYNKCTFWHHVMKETSKRHNESIKSEKTYMMMEPFLPSLLKDDVPVTASKSSISRGSLNENGDSCNKGSSSQSDVPCDKESTSQLSVSCEKEPASQENVICDKESTSQINSKCDKRSSSQVETITHDKRSSQADIPIDKRSSSQSHVTCDKRSFPESDAPSDKRSFPESDAPCDKRSSSLSNVTCDKRSSSQSDVPCDRRSLSQLHATHNERSSSLLNPYESSSSALNDDRHQKSSSPVDQTCNRNNSSELRTTSENRLSVILGGKKHSKKKTCPYCGIDIATPSLWNLHFKRSRNILYTCKICRMVHFNRCSLNAHSNIHSLEEKRHTVLCPECGETIQYSQSFQPVFEHLDSCFHFNSWSAISCRCGSILTSVDCAKDHVLKRHLKLYYECGTCLKRYPSVEILNLHLKSKHPLEMCTAVAIIQCGLCDTFFRNASTLQDHVEREISSSRFSVKKVYRCMLCPHLSAQVNSLIFHMETAHAHKPKRCTFCFALFKSRQSLVDHILSKKCSKRFPSHLHIFADSIVGNEPPFKNSQYAHLFQVKGLETLSFDVMEMTESMPVSLSSKSQKDTTQVLKTSVLNSNNNNTLTTQRQTPQVAYGKKPPASAVRPATKDGRKYQCHLCKICLVGFSNFIKHMSHHKSIGLKSGYTHCVVCKKLIGDSSIHSHMEEHQIHGVIVCSLCHRRDFASLDLARDHSKNWCYYKDVEGWGVDCIKEYEQATNELSNVDSTEQQEEQMERATSENIDVNPSGSNLSQTQNEASVYPCIMCGLAFSTKRARDDHVIRVHDGTRVLYICKFCKRRGTRKSFKMRQKLATHISRKHRINDYGAIERLIIREEQNILSGKVIIGVESPDEKSDDVSPPKQLRLEAEGTFLCGKCGFSDGQRDVFEQHIKTHNPKEEPQCPECGLCFTVNAALKKHLFAVHRIKKVDEYFTERGIQEPAEEGISDDEMMDSTSHSFVDVVAVFDDDDDSSKSKPCRHPKEKSASSVGQQWECTVCYRKFNCEAVLKSHMRNHGMAFIRSKRHKN